MAWANRSESFRRGTAESQFSDIIQEQDIAKYAYDKNGNLRRYEIRIYEQAFGLATDYDIYIDHGLNITIDDVVFVHGGIRGYNSTYPATDQNGVGPDGISREWMEFPSFGTNNYTPVSISVSNKYLHVRRVTSGAPSIIVTARIMLAYFIG